MPAGGCKPNVDHKKVAMLQSLAAKQQPDECQLWPGTLDPKGYGRIWFGGRWRIAHDVLFEVVTGAPRAANITLDHYLLNADPAACSKACVNLYHLELVPNEVNVMRGRGVCAEHARQTHCKRGHAFTPENTKRRDDGGRECWTCKRTAYAT